MKTAHILLVEDNEGDIVLTEEAFKAGSLANTMSVARDGEEALDFLRRKGKFVNAERPDLVLLDINIPKINGLEVLRIIKIDADLKQIPVIMLTTSSSEKDVQYAYNNYVNCYIIKPIDLFKFMDAVTEIENFWFRLVTAPNN